MVGERWGLTRWRRYLVTQGRTAPNLDWQCKQGAEQGGEYVLRREEKEKDELRRRKVIEWAGDRMCGSVRLARMSVLTSLLSYPTLPPRPCCYLSLKDTYYTSTIFWQNFSMNGFCFSSYPHHNQVQSKHGHFDLAVCYLNSWKLHLDTFGYWNSTSLGQFSL